MENGGRKRWGFQGNEELDKAASITIRGVLNKVMSNLNPQDHRPVIPLGHGDPSAFSCFRTTPVAEDAIVDALRSRKFNSYAPAVGILPARRAIAEHLSHDLPYKLSPDDIFLTIGCAQAIELIIKVLARPGANILLPRPGYPFYESHAAANHLEFRHFDLLPEKGWEVDLEGSRLLQMRTLLLWLSSTLEILVAETARMLGILVISDEVYAHLAFGGNPYVSMGAFGSITPVITLGSISKRWIVPGWRLGWLVTNDPNGILHKSGVVESIVSSLNISSDPATFIQGAVPQIIEKTTDDFYLKIISILRETADTCFDGIEDIPCLTCPHKPEGSMFVMLSKEESVIVFPGFAVGMKNWLRITFAIEPPSLEDGLGRIKAFYQRHARKQ
ncbi:Tyrosine aminotransferase [Vitis vinifera]|uniref:Tyrosine aminotransferase n=1 Tax=Vitis vinifera TaxID=29760 RepID=A0A438EGD7_VITVI|nr:Tyrosine aminotransferase [Vitis vinifera]